MARSKEKKKWLIFALRYRHPISLISIEIRSRSLISRSDIKIWSHSPRTNSDIGYRRAISESEIAPDMQESIKPLQSVPGHGHGDCSLVVISHKYRREKNYLISFHWSWTRKSRRWNSISGMIFWPLPMGSYRFLYPFLFLSQYLSESTPSPIHHSFSLKGQPLGRLRYRPYQWYRTRYH